MAAERHRHHSGTALLVGARVVCLLGLLGVECPDGFPPSQPPRYYARLPVLHRPRRPGVSIRCQAPRQRQTLHLHPHRPQPLLPLHLRRPPKSRPRSQRRGNPPSTVTRAIVTAIGDIQSGGRISSGPSIVLITATGTTIGAITDAFSGSAGSALTAFPLVPPARNDSADQTLYPGCGQRRDCK